MKLLQWVHQIDVRLFSRLMAIPNRELLCVWSRQISKTGDGYLYIAMAGVLWYQQRFDWLKALVMAFAIERSIYFLFKYSFRRSRPAQAIDGFISHIRPADRFSFPSGHTSGAFLFALFLSILFPPWTVAFFLWASMVACSRVLLGLHFPSDILFGLIVGLVCTGISIWIYI